ncbi:MAG: hypothetical protein O7G83_17600 [Proteobacteria bacterium]|nr:hypothetical protein [Pseudomonadota bacterium]
MNDYSGDEPVSALCFLYLQDDKWVPHSPNSELTARHRSTPNGPVIDAVVQATLLDANINSWGDLNFLVREVTDSGELEPIDLPQVARVFEAAREDEKAEAAGVIGISQKLERRARQSQRWQPSTGQLETLYKTAEHLILASYLGGRPIGVNIQHP